MKKFNENPVALIESLIGIDLPDDQINGVIDGIKAKISLDSVGDFLSYRNLRQIMTQETVFALL